MHRVEMQTSENEPLVAYEDDGFIIIAIGGGSLMIKPEDVPVLISLCELIK